MHRIPIFYIFFQLYTPSYPNLTSSTYRPLVIILLLVLNLAESWFCNIMVIQMNLSKSIKKPMARQESEESCLVSSWPAIPKEEPSCVQLSRNRNSFTSSIEIANQILLFLPLLKPTNHIPSSLMSVV